MLATVGMIPSPPPTVLFEVESAIRTTAKPPLLAPTSTSIRRFHVEYEVPGGACIPFFLSVLPHPVLPIRPAPFRPIPLRRPLSFDVLAYTSLFSDNLYV